MYQLIRQAASRIIYVSFRLPLLQQTGVVAEDVHDLDQNLVLAGHLVLVLGTDDGQLAVGARAKGLPLVH